MLYEQSLQIAQKLENPREIAVIQHGLAGLLVQMGERGKARMLYEQALHAEQEPENPRSIAVTQLELAHILVQEGEREEARALYEQVLQMFKTLEAPREIAVTQGALAGLLVRKGERKEAQMLYEQALQALEDLGNVHEIAIIQSGLGSLLFLEGEASQGLFLIWEAYTSFCQHNFPSESKGVQNILIDLKVRTANDTQFASWWEQSIKEPQPEWLAKIQSEEDVPTKTEVEQAVIDFFKISVEAFSIDALEQFLQEHRTLVFSQEADDFLRQLIVYTNQQGDQELANRLETNLELIRASQKYGITATFARFSKPRQAVLDFCKAPTLALGEQFLQEHQALLFSQEAEDFLQKCISEQKQLENHELASSLEGYFGLLQACKEQGIATIFEQIRSGQEP